MDDESEGVIRFLGGIVAAQERLHELARLLRQCPQVHKASVHRFSPARITRYDQMMSGSQAIGGEFGVSAQMADGAVVDWWLEVWRGERTWHVDYNVHQSDAGEDGSHVAVAFAGRQAATTGALLISLAEAVEDLAAVRWQEALLTR